MTTQTLLSRIRTLLDEDVEQHWSDIECYAALSDAQNEIIKIVWDKFKKEINTEIPLVLSDLVVSVNQTGITASQVALPTDYFDILSLKVGLTATAGQIPAVLREQNEDKYYLSDNPYLQSSPTGVLNTDIIYGVIPPNLEFETALVAGQIRLDYIKIPVDIDGDSDPVVEPTINQVGHEAMVWYAWGVLLNKAKLPMAEAMRMFTNLVGVL